MFRGIENLSDFLTSQERQAIIYHLLTSLRAEKGDKVGDKVAFLEGEAIGKNYFLKSNCITKICLILDDQKLVLLSVETNFVKG